MLVLKKYEAQSGQMINKENSAYYMHQNAAAVDILTKSILQAWKGNMLSYGGKEVLITSV
ncbi:hypothetical protein H5410_027078 [Solanum commersonii]|uniref:Uncharacterized protein n=1 Tax=Solanum commersonii TaxID=4109 RepID=A0A9J5YYU8_SOLCO|nr:hypothetical protein H5410_027078 [Solanum commersonii]